MYGPCHGPTFIFWANITPFLLKNCVSKIRRQNGQRRHFKKCEDCEVRVVCGPSSRLWTRLLEIAHSPSAALQSGPESTRSCQERKLYRLAQIVGQL
jgi:hypothetical protein